MTHLAQEQRQIISIAGIAATYAETRVSDPHYLFRNHYIYRAIANATLDTNKTSFDEITLGTISNLGPLTISGGYT